MSVTWYRRQVSRARRLRRELGDLWIAVALVGLAGILVLVSLGWSAQFRPASGLAGPVLLGGLLLGRRAMAAVAAASAALLAMSLAALGVSALTVGTSINYVLVLAVALELARRRDRPGLRARRPDMILRELQARLAVQGELPPLPAGWAADTELRPAHGSGLAGDFMVSRLGVDARLGRTLDLALVDVSGKGVDAGTRALLLSGALGGLLGAVPPERFLAEANRYLLDQRWAEGFATAVYLRVELDSGAYRLESAGHPPAVQFDAGAGTWRITRSSGPLLGVLPRVRFVAHTGRLRHGDALLLYTDGLVEYRDQDIEVGLDRLLGAAEELVPRGGFHGGAAVLVDQAPSRTDDDRAVVLVWRER